MKQISASAVHSYARQVTTKGKEKFSKEEIYYNQLHLLPIGVPGGETTTPHFIFASGALLIFRTGLKTLGRR
ncbi:MAG: hypothetical protein Q8858_10840 [Bacteroidota bacterium]|nr:hypothetical protein [Bacteroidota bacterium]